VISVDEGAMRIPLAEQHCVTSVDLRPPRYGSGLFKFGNVSISRLGVAEVLQ
jgi:hypothetical protein